MKHTRAKLAGLIVISLIVAFGAILLAFNTLMNKYIEDNAYTAIASQRQEYSYYNSIDGLENFAVNVPSPENAKKFMLLTNELWLTTDYQLPVYDSEIGISYSSTEKTIAQWVANNHNTAGSITREKINFRSYYITQVAMNYATESSDDDEILILYVDITSELYLIRIVNTAILIIMLICCLGACLAGSKIGKTIEHDQERQKTFFANASHELKTPLMAIQGYADGLGSGIITDEKKAARIIIKESNKMAKLVDEILCLSRIESGETKLHRETVTLESIVNDCLIAIEMTAAKRGLQITTDLCDKTVEADAAQLEKAIGNILTNAVRYAKTKIHISYDGKALIILDDGRPLAPDELKHLFERFYTGKNGNTGIGMSLTKEIIEMHGWKITAENAAPGTRFIITTRR